MNRKEKEDLTLLRLITDRRLWNTWKILGAKRLGPLPPEDEFSQSLDRLIDKGVLSVALVFEAQIFLDI